MFMGKMAQFVHAGKLPCLHQLPVEVSSHMQCHCGCDGSGCWWRGIRTTRGAYKFDKAMLELYSTVKVSDFRVLVVLGLAWGQATSLLNPLLTA